jgi:MFS family permease
VSTGLFVLELVYVLPNALQQYVPEPHRETVYLPSILYDPLGRRLDINRHNNYVGSLQLFPLAQINLRQIRYHGALLTRFFLGFVEAAFFPGALFLLSKWYKRSELGQRTALLSCGMLISNAFGSLIASLILDMMEGKGGKAAWR